MATKAGRESDPLVGFQFAVDVGGKITGYFSEIGGISIEHEIIEHKVVTDDGHEVIQKIPGRAKYTDITLKRGVTDSMQIWEWLDKVHSGTMKDARQNCSILMFDRNYEVAARWDITNAWPSKITGPNGKADGNEIGIEELVLVHEGLKRVKA